MKIYNKEFKELFKNEILKAKLNVTDCLVFVAMQEFNGIVHREFKNLNTICEKLNNLWDYVDFCIDNDIIIDISDYSYYLVRDMSELHVEDYKEYYINNGEFYLSYV